MLKIKQLDSVLFVLKQPYYIREQRRRGTLDYENGDPRFWYAKWTVVNEFLDKLWQVAVAPIDRGEEKQLDFRGRSEKQEQLYLFIPDNQKLKEFGGLVGEADRFFCFAEGAYVSD